MLLVAAIAQSNYRFSPDQQVQSFLRVNPMRPKPLENVGGVNVSAKSLSGFVLFATATYLSAVAQSVAACDGSGEISQIRISRSADDQGFLRGIQITLHSEGTAEYEGSKFVKKKGS
jgi:hypothetical protein